MPYCESRVSDTLPSCMMQLYAYLVCIQYRICYYELVGLYGCYSYTTLASMYNNMHSSTAS